MAAAEINAINAVMVVHKDHAATTAINAGHAATVTIAVTTAAGQTTGHVPSCGPPVRSAAKVVWIPIHPSRHCQP